MEKIKYHTKKVAPNARFTSLKISKSTGNDYDVFKVQFSQGYNYYHLRLLSSELYWGIALSDDAIVKNTLADGSIDYCGDGILSGEWNSGLILSQPMCSSFYVIVTNPYCDALVKIYASDSPVYPFTYPYPI